MKQTIKTAKFAKKYNVLYLFRPMKAHKMFGR